MLSLLYEKNIPTWFYKDIKKFINASIDNDLKESDTSFKQAKNDDFLDFKDLVLKSIYTFIDYFEYDDWHFGRIYATFSSDFIKKNEKKVKKIFKKTSKKNYVMFFLLEVFKENK